MVAAVAGLVARSGIGAERVSRLEIAVEEWLVNLCRHAYANQGGPIEVVVREASAQVSVEIADEGRPFDPTAFTEPDVSAPLADRQVGGLGLLLIRRLTDEVRYRRDGARNVTTLSLAALSPRTGS